MVRQPTKDGQRIGAVVVGKPSSDLKTNLSMDREDEFQMAQAWDSGTGRAGFTSSGAKSIRQA